jgi:hypothetical protein
MSTWPIPRPSASEDSLPSAEPVLDPCDTTLEAAYFVAAWGQRYEFVDAVHLKVRES